MATMTSNSCTAMCSCSSSLRGAKWQMIRGILNKIVHVVRFRYRFRGLRPRRTTVLTALPDGSRAAAFTANNISCTPRINEKFSIRISVILLTGCENIIFYASGTNRTGFQWIGQHHGFKTFSPVCIHNSPELVCILAAVKIQTGCIVIAVFVISHALVYFFGILYRAFY